MLETICLSSFIHDGVVCFLTRLLDIDDGSSAEEAVLYSVCIHTNDSEYSTTTLQAWSFQEPFFSFYDKNAFSCSKKRMFNH